MLKTQGCKKLREGDEYKKRVGGDAVGEVRVPVDYVGIMYLSTRALCINTGWITTMY